MIYWKCFFYRFVNNFSALLLCEINVFDICNTVDFFRFLLYHEGMKFRSNQTFGFEHQHCPLLGDTWMKLIEILWINVKLIDEVKSYSFFRWINGLNYNQKSALRKVTTITYLLHWCTKPNYFPLYGKKFGAAAALVVWALPHHGFNAAAAPLLRQRQAQKEVRRCSLVCGNAAVPKQRTQWYWTVCSLSTFTDGCCHKTLVPQSPHTVRTQRSQNKRAVVLCIGCAAAFCLTRQCYLFVQQLPQVSFRVEDTKIHTFKHLISS